MHNYKFITFISIFLAVNLTHANTSFQEIDQREKAQFQQRLESLKKLSKSPHVQLETKTTSTESDFIVLPINEDPCFYIYDIQLTSSKINGSPFRTILDPIKYGPNSVLGRCIGQKGLQFISRQVQNEVLKQGFITTRVEIPAQDLTGGKLIINIIPGKLDKIWRSNISSDKVNPSNALTLRGGDVINLRAIETSLEKFRLPSTTDTSIEIIPSVNTILNSGFGYSDIVITQFNNFPLGFQLTVDDSGNEDTGLYQGTITTTLDHPLSSNDVLNLSYTHSIDPWNNTDTDSNNHSLYVSYLYPYKNWQFQITHSDYDFNQTLLGLNNDIVYRGETKQNSISANRIIHRNQNSKTSVNIGGYHKSSEYYFDDQEIEVQRRRTSGWKIGLKQQRTTKLGQLIGSINYKKGSGAFSALKAPESYIDNIESQPSIITANINARLPFKNNRSDYYYQVNLAGQYTPHNLTPQEQFIIGGRSTVRGINGQQGLSGDRGFLLQQEIGRVLRPTSQSSLIPYLSLDQGFVFGDSIQYLAGNHLIGTSFGLKLNMSNFSINGFIGKTVKAPKSLKKETTTGFSATIYN